MAIGDTAAQKINGNDGSGNTLFHAAKSAILDAEKEYAAKDGSENPSSPTAARRWQTDAFASRVAASFLQTACPEFVVSSLWKENPDRAVKIGRGVFALFRSTVTGRSVVSENDDGHDDAAVREKLEASLGLVVRECRGLMEIHEKRLTVPRVMYGKTGIDMPIVTVGCMRFQQSWNRGSKQVKSMADVEQECQDNLLGLLRYAFRHGCNHIETALGYGSSEMQLGAVLKGMFERGEVKREDIILQSKVNPSADPNTFRENINKSLRTLQVDYLDLFSFHGLNLDCHYDWIFNNGPQKNLMDVVKEFVDKGIIRHVGFSTHGNEALIRRCIETDAFAYVNLHHHYLGSYTTTGDGLNGTGNAENVKLLRQKDMGCFQISPFDKAGRLYAPSRKLRELCLPDLEPLSFGALWAWQHDKLYDGDAPIHTITCGLARPSDLDQPLVAAITELTQNPDRALRACRSVMQRVRSAMDDAFDPAFIDTWHAGVPNWSDCPPRYAQLAVLSWYNILVKALGMVAFCRERYESMEGHAARWNFDKTWQENTNASLGFWGYMPGVALVPGEDYSKFLKDCPDANRPRILEGLDFVRKVLVKNSTEPIPLDWETAYDMRPWAAFPER